MKSPKKLIEDAQKSKIGLDKDGLYSHQIGEDVCGEIIISEIDSVINAYKLVRKSCLSIIKEWSKKHFDKDSGDYYINEEDIEELKNKLKEARE